MRPEDIESYVAAKRRTLAIKTIRNHVNTMHSVFELGLRKGWCQINPVKLADRPTLKKTETRIQFLDQPELEQLLSVSYPDDAFGQIEPTLYLTAAMTGLRQGELLGLRWRDVDFDARKVRVVSPLVRGEFGDPKSAGSGPSVPMAERVALALGELREHSYYAHDRDLVFCHPETGKPLDRSKLVRRFKQALDRAEVHRITFHELRHTFARAWRPPVHLLGPCSTGWATQTRRRRRSTLTTSRATTRQTRSIRRLRDPELPRRRSRGHGYATSESVAPRVARIRAEALRRRAQGGACSRANAASSGSATAHIRSSGCHATPTSRSRLSPSSTVLLAAGVPWGLMPRLIAATSV